jgi:DNA-binding transcriptional ArsR family regulator
MPDQQNLPRNTFKATEDELAREENFALIAKALSHPARLRILKILIKLENKEDGCLNGALVPCVGLAQSTVSEHLRVLKKTGLIRSESNPPKVCYFINKEKLKAFSILLTEDYL